MLPTPDESLASLGAFIRAARMSRNINQVKAAKDAKVSRRQLALLEKGGNVSVKFLLKVARLLNLSHIPLDGNIELVSGGVGVNVVKLMETLDLVSLLVEHAKGFALEAVLPQSERPKLRDTPAFRDFVARHQGDAEGTERLASALLQMSDDVAADRAAPAVAEEEASEPRSRRRATRRRRQ